MKTSAADLGRTIPSFDAAGFMNLNTVISGHLYVGSALPDPPFEFMDGDNARGFDVQLMQAIAAELGLTWQLVSYTGGDFKRHLRGAHVGNLRLHRVRHHDHTRARTQGRVLCSPRDVPGQEGKDKDLKC